MEPDQTLEVSSGDYLFLYLFFSDKHTRRGTGNVMYFEYYSIIKHCSDQIQRYAISSMTKSLHDDNLGFVC